MNGTGFAIVMAVAVLCMILFGVALAKRPRAAASIAQPSSDATIKKTIFAICVVYGIQGLLTILSAFILALLSILFGENGASFRSLTQQYPLVADAGSIGVFILGAWVTSWYAGRKGWLRDVDPIRVVIGITIIIVALSAFFGHARSISDIILQIIEIYVLYYFLRRAKKST